MSASQTSLIAQTPPPLRAQTQTLMSSTTLGPSIPLLDSTSDSPPINEGEKKTVTVSAGESPQNKPLRETNSNTVFKGRA
ncbi:hypothetical protein B0H17DRAFT_1035798 [Mycena rosella]|uniref:Uncharacterized protein n=1 Tax=Mycena rosella TaxID=1033263 RepID=A0AAD7GVF5_MYCRO|nr:hypothetical protein B0H17DRAFT_1035798 [Mycena rosella]